MGGEKKPRAGALGFLAGGGGMIQYGYGASCRCSERLEALEDRSGIGCYGSFGKDIPFGCRTNKEQ